MSVFQEITDAWRSLPEETSKRMDFKSFEFAWLMRDSEIRMLRRQISELHSSLVETTEEVRT